MLIDIFNQQQIQFIQNYFKFFKRCGGSSFKKFFKQNNNIKDICETFALKVNLTINDIIVYILNNTFILKQCKICKKYIKYKHVSYCSKECMLKDIDNINKLVGKRVKQYFQKNYNVNNPFQLDNVKKRIAKSNLEKYNAINPFSSLKIQQKIKETHNKKLGVNHPFKSQLVKKKYVNTLKNKYNVNNSFQLQKTINHNRIKLKEKSWQTILAWNNYVIPLFTFQQYLNTINTQFNWKCNKCNNSFKQRIYTTGHINDNNIKASRFIPRCPNCFPMLAGISKLQKQVVQFCKQHFPNLLENDRKIIKPYELDIVIPQIRLAIQFNGNYWHSIQAGIQKEMHLNKVLNANQQGYRLLYIWQDQWNNNKEEIKQKLIEIFENRQNLQNCQHLDFSWYNGDAFKIVKFYQPEIKIHGQYQTFNCGYIDICFQKSLKK